MLWLIIAFCEPQGERCIIDEKKPYETAFDCDEAARDVDLDRRYVALSEKLALDVPLELEGRTYCLSSEELKELGIEAP